MPRSLLVGTEWEFRHRGWLMVLACAAVLALARAVPDPLTGRRPWIELPWMCVAAAVLASAGTAIRVWATGYLPFAIIADRAVRAPRLVTRGPYAVTRNPLYLGTWLVVVSVALVSNLWAALLLPPVMALRIRRIIGFEESRLAVVFGARYAAYQARVPRLVPRSFFGVREAFAEGHDWLYGIRGNLFLLGVPIGYLAAIARPSFGTIAALVAVGLVAQWPLLRSERRAREREDGA